MTPRRRSVAAQRSPSPRQGRTSSGTSSGNTGGEIGGSGGGSKSKSLASSRAQQLETLSSATVHGYMIGSLLFLAGTLAADFGSDYHKALCQDYHVMLIGTIAYLVGSATSLAAHYIQ